jgi:hypothetical protein
MIVLSVMSMYVLMYAMVNTLGDVYQSLNQVYMAGLMTAPMVVIERLLMSGMYKNKRLNVLLIAGSCVAGIAFFLFIRQQVGIADHQFLRSMIPYHSGAILMCREALIEDQSSRTSARRSSLGRPRSTRCGRSSRRGEEADSVRARAGSRPARMRSVRAAS